MELSDPDAVVTRFYELYTFPLGRAADRGGLADLFWPTARVRSAVIGAQGEDVLDISLDEYLDVLSRVVEETHACGTPLVHQELWRQTDRYGTMAHVWTTYEAAMGVPGAEIEARAALGFQLMEARGRWWIAGLVSYTERRAEPIPARYLPESATVRPDHRKAATTVS